MKICSKCNETKPKSAFSKHADRRDGLQDRCKCCIAESYTTNAAKISIQKADYYAANKAKINARQSRYRAANRLSESARCAAWAKANPEAIRIFSHNRRARIRADGGKLSKGLIPRLFALQKGRCSCCGLPLGADYHMDHIMPLTLGGSNTDDNIQLLRATCNQQKSAAHPVDFMQERGFLL